MTMGAAPHGVRGSGGWHAARAPPASATASTPQLTSVTGLVLIRFWQTTWMFHQGRDRGINAPSMP
jgi:hypothetical protein